MAAASPEPPWRQADGCVIVRVRVTPKSSKTKVEAVGVTERGLALFAHVAPAPEDGAANTALEELLSRWLELPRRAASVVGGHRARLKTVALAGDVAVLEARLATAIAGLPKRRT